MKLRKLAKLSAVTVVAVCFEALLLLRFNSCGGNTMPQSSPARCGFTLREIGVAIQMYEEDHEQQPDSWSHLVPDYLRSPHTLLAPGSKKQPGDLNDIDRWSDYRYVRPANRKGDPSVVVYMPPWNNKWQMGFVLLSDGEVLSFHPEVKGSETFEAFMAEHGF